MNAWIARFDGYRQTVTEPRVTAWLQQFNEGHRDLAARVLDAIEYLTPNDVDDALRALLVAVPGWHKKSSVRRGKWFFVGLGPTGTSGHRMLSQFRTANKLDADSLDHLFIHMAELIAKYPGPDDTVVFIDDFAGSGEQICNFWKQGLGTMLPGEPRVYLLLVGATEVALQRIGEATGLQPLAHRTFGADDNVFSETCGHFSEADKQALLAYCERADRRQPHGFGGCGLVVVLAHRCPNNSLPVLHASKKKFRGLFPRA